MAKTRRDGWAVESDSLENYCSASYPGFESLSLRHFELKKIYVIKKTIWSRYWGKLKMQKMWNKFIDYEPNSLTWLVSMWTRAIIKSWSAWGREETKKAFKSGKEKIAIYWRFYENSVEPKRNLYKIKWNIPFRNGICRKMHYLKYFVPISHVNYQNLLN